MHISTKASSLSVQTFMAIKKTIHSFWPILILTLNVELIFLIKSKGTDVKWMEHVWNLRLYKIPKFKKIMPIVQL